jgi:transposase
VTQRLVLLVLPPDPPPRGDSEGSVGAVEVLIERCVGLDVGKADVKACVRVPSPRGGRRQQIKTFATTTKELLLMRQWLIDQQVTVAGIEATGDYWKPVYYLLEDAVEVQLLNAAHMHNVPGRKTDVSDSAWIARLVEHGLVRASFVPPPPIRRLRDLTRYRAALIGERTREKQRMEKLLEDAGIKLSVFVSDLFGVSGRAMLAALVDGERDPQVLAGYAQGRMRPKMPALVEALTGRFGEHHAFLCRMMLERVRSLDAAIDTVTAQVEVEIAPFQAVVDRLDTIPGVNQRAAQVIVAEIGVDMSRFPTAAHLASWAGMCPGNNESAGKHFSGRTRKGDRWLRAVLGEAAAAATGKKDSYPRAQYRRLASRRGKKRALVAVGHSLLIAAWHVIDAEVDYQDLGPLHFLTRVDPARQTRRLVTQLQQLGYRVELNPSSGG